MRIDSDINLEETTKKLGETEYEIRLSMYTYNNIVKKNEECISLAKSKSLIKMFNSKKFDLKFSDEDESISNVSTNSKKSNNMNNNETKTKTIHVYEFESWSIYTSSDESIRMVIVCRHNTRGGASSCIGLKTQQFSFTLFIESNDMKRLG